MVYDLLFRTATIAPLPYETAGPSSNFTNSGISRSPSIAPASNQRSQILDELPGERVANAALLREIDRIIDGDRYFLSERIETLKAIRAKIRRQPLPPPPKQYAPPRCAGPDR